MSVLENLFGRFANNNQAPQGQPGSDQQNQQNPQGQPQPQQQQPQQTQQLPGDPQTNHLVPNANNTPPNPSGAQTPVDNFANLFKIDPNANKEQAPLFNLNQEEFSKQIAAQNFTSGVAQEDVAALQEALGGNKEATAALLRIANKIGQNSFGTSVQASARLTESGVQHTRSSLMSELPNHFKRQVAQDDIFTAYPELKRESVQPLVSTVQQMVQQNHPNATVQEANALVVQYFTEHLPSAFGKKTQDVPKQAASTPESGNFASWLK